MVDGVPTLILRWIRSMGPLPGAPRWLVACREYVERLLTDPAPPPAGADSGARRSCSVRSATWLDRCFQEVRRNVLEIVG